MIRQVLQQASSSLVVVCLCAPALAAPPSTFDQPPILLAQVAQAAPAAPAQRPAPALEPSGSIVELELPQPEVAEPYLWNAIKSADGAIAFTGFVPAASLKNFLEVQSGAAADQTEIRDGAPEDFAVDVLTAINLLDLLEAGEVTFDGTDWAATGQALPDANLTDVLASAADWDLDLENQPEPQTEQPIAERVEAALAEVPDTSVATTQCSARLAELSAHNAILFQSGAAIIADSAGAELDAFADALSLCPNSAVSVEGHTDSDGDDRQNLVLSVSRAEAVVNALISRGIAAERLYAIGFGESQPVADNATADGKRQNRRIVISLRADD